MSVIIAQPIACMPDGTPAPYLLTLPELIRFLRIDTTAARFPEDSIRRIRKRYGLRAVPMSRTVLFRLPDVLDIVAKIAEENPR